MTRIGGDKMNIAIIDDNLEELNNITLLIDHELQKYLSQYHIDHSLQFLDMNVYYDILFLDIDMPKDGIELAKEYMKYHKKSTIVFISHHHERVFDTFDVHPYQFIKKTELDLMIPIVISSLVKKIDIDHRKITIKTENGGIDIPLSHIQYIKSDKHYCMIKTIHTQYRIREKLIDLLNRINDDDFCRIHNSIIVNWQYVEEFTDNTIKINKKYLPVSQSKVKEVKRSYIYFIERIIS